MASIDRRIRPFRKLLRERPRREIIRQDEAAATSSTGASSTEFDLHLRQRPDNSDQVLGIPDEEKERKIQTSRNAPPIRLVSPTRSRSSIPASRTASAFRISSQRPTTPTIKPPSSMSRASSTPKLWASALIYIFHPSTLIVILLLFVSLSAMMIAVATQKKRGSTCIPSITTMYADDGFWTLLSQLFLQVLSIYCTLYLDYFSTEERTRLRKFWFRVLLAVSFLSTAFALVSYAWSWKAAILLSFVSGSAQIILLGQVAVSLRPPVKIHRSSV